jgi:hypothetical protein
MSLNQKLENIPGNLRDAYKQCVPGTFLCTDKLMNERRSYSGLRRKWFYTADGEVYSLDDGVPTLRVTREATNPVLRHLFDKGVCSSYDQLMHKHYYNVTPADFKAVKNSIDTIIVDLTRLRLGGEEKEWRSLAIDTKRYAEKLNDEERKFAERVYGQGSDFVANMRLLRCGGISMTYIFVLSLDYVKSKAKKGPLGLVSALGHYLYDSSFVAHGCYIGSDSFIRGIRKAVLKTL